MVVPSLGSHVHAGPNWGPTRLRPHAENKDWNRRERWSAGKQRGSSEQREFDGDTLSSR